jgi:hypothetical protein
MGLLETDEPTSGGKNGQSALASQKRSDPGAWRFDTLQVHAGLEKSPAYGQCTLPVYNSASFKFNSSAVAGRAFTVMDKYIYSRCDNVSPLLQGIEEQDWSDGLIWINLGSPPLPDLSGAWLPWRTGSLLCPSPAVPRLFSLS